MKPTYNTKKEYRIWWNWNDLKSIKKAERQKSYAENKGYTLIETCPMYNNNNVLIYKKQ